MTKPLRAALYARVSTNDQKADLQLRELRTAAEQRSWRVIGEFVDEGISGAKASRPRLNALKSTIARGRVDLVAVWRLDRLGRSVVHLLRTLDEWTQQGVEFVSLRDSGVDTTTPTGRLLLTMLAAVAEFERRIIQERSKAGMEAARARGVQFGRPKLEIDLRPALAMLEKNHSIRQVADATGISRSTLCRRLAEHRARQMTKGNAHSHTVGLP